jgi:hypothetical protein
MARATSAGDLSDMAIELFYAYARDPVPLGLALDSDETA